MTRWEPFDTNVLLVTYAIVNSQCWHFRKSVCKSANCGLKVLSCGFANQFLTANICGFAVKKVEIYCKSADKQHRWDVSVQFTKKKRFYGSMYRQSWVVIFIKYNTPLPSSTVLERLFSKGAAILTAKRANLTSRNFQQLIFLKEKLGFLKWKGVTQVDMPSTSSK